MDYVRLAKIEDFSQIKIKSFSLMGKRVAIILRNDGSFYAIEASCKHQGADLTEGEVVNSIATCPRHQWQYDLESGRCLTNDSLPLRKYGLKIDGENIYVTLTPLDD